MGKVVFIAPVDHVSGKLFKDCVIIFKYLKSTKNKFTSLYTKSTKAPSVTMLNARTKFASAMAETKQIMLSDQLRAPYEVEYKKQNKYKSLRTFIFASVLPNQ